MLTRPGLLLLSLLSPCLGLLLTGCAWTSGDNSAPDPHSTALAAQAQYQMANEAVAQVVKLHPPAKVRIALLQPATDSFGAALLENLRESGYAVIEETTANPVQTQGTQARTEAIQGHQVAPGQAPLVQLAYVLEPATDPTLYRMTLFLNQQSLSRLYWSGDDKPRAAGHWLYRE